MSAPPRPRAAQARRHRSDACARCAASPSPAGLPRRPCRQFDSRADIEIDNLICAGSVFVGVDTFFRPIFLGYGHTDSGDGSFHLGFGSFVRAPN